MQDAAGLDLHRVTLFGGADAQPRLDRRMMRSPLTPQVEGGLAAQPEHLIYTTAVSEAEVLAGIEILPDGHRRDALEKAARAMFADDLEGRILPFDSKSAAAYADIFASRRRDGRPTAPQDLMIAAIARARGAVVVTRDTSGFEGCGLILINPWEPPG